MKYKLKLSHICQSCIDRGGGPKVGSYLVGTQYNDANSAYVYAANYNQDPHPLVPSCKCTVEVVEVEE